jgi:NADH-quinone oxidoreductase subunit N
MNASTIQMIWPEVVLACAACVLMLLGVSAKVLARKTAPVIGVGVLIVIFAMLVSGQGHDGTLADASGAIRINSFALYIKLIAAGIGALLLLLSWPTNREGTGNNAMDYGQEAGEFFGLALLSICGLMLVASANDIILLFLGLELASLPTYVMVSISRPLPVAQEAGVKYFFLGAMSAAIMLFGFSYLYGTTGTTDLNVIAHQFSATLANSSATTQLNSWQMLAVVMLIVGFAFKLAAVPLHFYAGDVYQGAATPMTAFLAFVPKTSGVVALIKILYAVGGGAGTASSFNVPSTIFKLLWAMAALTMIAGNVLGLLQSNVKRTLAYSSIAHSGYLLVGVTTLVAARGSGAVQEEAMAGILFYLAAYGLMNTGAFGVLALLPARDKRPGTSAETFDDLAGQGRKHVALGLAMAVSCFSLIGLPLTVGFFGKFLLIRPALGASLYGLVVIMLINAAISAAYYLRIVGTMFLRPEAEWTELNGEIKPAGALPMLLAVGLSAAGTLLFGVVFPATELLSNYAHSAHTLDENIAPAGSAANVAVSETTHERN